MKIIYIKTENSHFDGFIDGVVVDEENSKVALFELKGIADATSIEELGTLEWLPLGTYKENGRELVISAKGGFYKSFYYLNKTTL